MQHVIIAIVLVALVFSVSAQKPSRPNPVVHDMHKLFQERFEWEMREFPHRAMEKGDYRYADRLADMSLAAIERRHTETQDFLARLRALDRSRLPEAELINFELFELDLSQAVQGHQFREFLAPIGPIQGPQQDIPQLGERVRFSSFQDYDNYLKRLSQVPKLVEDTIQKLKLGADEGRTPPKVTVLGVPSQFRGLIEGGGLAMLRDPLVRMPSSIPQAQQQDLRERFDKHVLPQVQNAVTKLGEYVSREYLPRCRESISAIDWPDGKAYYDHQLRVMTTLNLSAAEIYAIGLREVARIRSEMMNVIRRSDFLSLHPEAVKLKDEELFKAFIKYLRTDPRFYHTTEQALLSGYRDICKKVDAELPRFFKRLPRLPYGVKEIPRFMAPQQTTAYYQNGDIRNAQPGWFMANTYALDQRPKYEMIPLAMHEAVPGHHLEIALAQEIDDIPEFRKDMWITAFGEGWALYSERLGIEMGLYADPYDDFGRLLYEMWRACRLVVDPGMHALGWSREQAIEFMKDNTALSELNIENEIDRYISWPGQTTGYKLGELKFRELRERAETELGSKFDIREFHDVALAAGRVPMAVLERRVDAWIDQAKKR